MKLIKDFKTGSFARIVWLNRSAKETWEQPLKDIARFVQRLEILSVAEGSRLCSWQTVNENRVTEQVQEWANLGLVALPVKEVAQFNGFAHRHEKVAPGAPKAVCYVVSRAIGDCLRYKTAFLMNDNVEQGRLLGFPECCSKFFQDVWAEGYFDPMWQMAKNSNAIENGPNTLRVNNANPYSNPLLRYIGIRVGFHIPCSLACKSTIELAKSRMCLAAKTDEQLTILLDALLRMPMSWDTLHGIAVVKTPIFYLIAQSCPTLENYTVKVDGPFVPREAENAPLIDS